jgi:hypothetical protein
MKSCFTLTVIAFLAVNIGYSQLDLNNLNSDSLKTVERNKMLSFPGEIENGFEDSRVYVLFTGNIDSIVANLSQYHATKVELDAKHNNYKWEETGTPMWFYGGYEVVMEVVKFEDFSLLKFHILMPSLPERGNILRDFGAWSKLVDNYQPIIDELVTEK